MKELRSKVMRKLLAQGKRKAHGAPPSEGTLVSLIYKTLPSGWHYQVEWVHDVRVHPTPFVSVYAFKPPRTYCAKSADYFLDNRET